MATTKTTKKKANEMGDLQDTGQNVAIGRASDYTLFYADGVRMSISAYDVKLVFSINEVLPNGDMRITEIATIALSPLHAKELSEKLAFNVARYENEFMPLEVKQEYKDLRDKNLRTIYKLSEPVAENKEEG
jgi:hypothetical protein